MLATGRATYPDASMVCGAIEGDAADPTDTTSTNPILVVEVLSLRSAFRAGGARRIGRACAAARVTSTPVDPCVIVIFGAAGDLTRRELVPALFELHCQQLLPKQCAVVGFSLGEWDSTTFREDVRRAWASERPGGDLPIIQLAPPGLQPPTT